MSKTAEEQLDAMESYISLPKFKGKLNTLTDFYLAVLFPVDCGKGNQSNHIVFDNSLPISYKNGKPIKNLNYWRNVSYAANPAFHKEGKKEKGKTYVWEIAENVKEWFDMGLKNKTKEYSCQKISSSKPIIRKCRDNKCVNYADPIENPRINNQSDNVNKNRFHRSKRINSTHPNGYYHTGVDILASVGTSVHSMLCGEVYDLKNTLKTNEYIANSLGNYVVIYSKDKDEKDVYIKYCHLDSVSVKKGDKISHKDEIGKSGSTGNAASVYRDGKLIHGINPQYRHVHIEASRDSSFGNNRIDPEQLKTKFDETTKGNILK